jgi:hypothetical protein
MSRKLSFGMRGDDVAAVQRLLNYHLPRPNHTPLDVDGKFGNETLKRVKEFQRLNRNYPMQMPIRTGDGVVKKPLAIDGIVGPNTGRVLLDERTVTMWPSTKFTPQRSEGGRATDRTNPALRLTSAGDPPAPTPTPPSPPPKTITFITLQAGSQAQANPWAIQPFVLTGQFTALARNAGKPDLLLTAGGQFSKNLGTVNGDWSAQIFGQMSLGNLGVQLGPLDFVNPLVQFMLTANQGQPLAAGLALGNQINLTLKNVTLNGIEQPRFSVFVNLQEVVNVGTNNGFCSAPATQGMLGLSWTFAPSF